MTRGPSPKYTPEQRTAQGNPGHKRKDDVRVYETGLPDDALPETLIEVPAPPEWLVSDSDTSALAQQAWNALAPIMVKARALRDGDQMSLARLCRYLAEWAECCLVLDDEGLTISTPKGRQRHPMFMARQQLEASIASLEKELGLSPKARLDLAKRLMASLADLPLAGQRKDGGRSGGPVGFLSDDSDD